MQMNVERRRERTSIMVARVNARRCYCKCRAKLHRQRLLRFVGFLSIGVPDVARISLILRKLSIRKSAFILSVIKSGWRIADPKPSTINKPEDTRGTPQRRNRFHSLKEPRPMVDFIRKRLQVFLSSTFSDLIAERQAAVEAILTAGHIPA
jgi:hypothetical protein